MAFYSGAVNSFADLRTALVDACVAEGWTWADEILSKGAAYIRPYTAATTTVVEGAGLLIQGGTGKAAGVLTGASDVIPRLGRVGVSSSYVDITFPASYSIHISDAPDEVFLFIRYSVDRFGWLAFGVSDVPGLSGTGLWLAAIARRGWVTGSATTTGFVITPIEGGGTGANGTNAARGCPGLFWCSLRAASDADSRQDCIHANLDGEGWSGAQTGTSLGAFNAIYPAVPLIAYSPSLWNSESILLPVQGHVWRASNKSSLVVDLRSARYVRVDNYEPEQIISIGPDRWKIYPFHQKNSAARDGGSNIGHSGTFGLAVRYDGP